MKRIALLPEGSVSHEAVVHLFGNEPVEFVHHKLISDVFLSTVQGNSDYSVIPIENTIEGSVSLHMDWLVNEVDIPMQLEWVYPSIQNLIGNKEEFMNENDNLDLSKITKILSHPVATAQCQQFIRNHAPQAILENVGSTSEAVEIVKTHTGQGWAAIGTLLGAKTHGLDVIATRITDHDNNFTRFVLIGADSIELQRPSTQTKTSITVTLPEDYPGALHQVLSAFAWRKLNLSRIESRPTKKRLGSYYFYIDILEEMNKLLLQASIAEIEAVGCQVRILGCYPIYSYEKQNSEVQ
ncbi:prephenate dehydratase [Paenibacillus sp. DS2015]|uniref:prephenate dehydratase n=1 Tax=Paenibacillus sp. DS2015 TaxID=3373917 RepID=UPI003D1C9FC4